MEAAGNIFVTCLSFWMMLSCLAFVTYADSDDTTVQPAMTTASLQTTKADMPTTNPPTTKGEMPTTKPDGNSSGGGDNGVGTQGASCLLMVSSIVLLQAWKKIIV